jgi:hypothetical protein
MNIIVTCRFVALSIVAVGTPTFGQPESISAAAVLDFASKPYDKNSVPKREVLGVLDGAEVVVDYICSDICPNYTVRIIHFGVEPGPGCRAIDGVEREVIVPRGIAAGPRAFCFPRVLIENWDAYIR